jgi:integrase
VADGTARAYARRLMQSGSVARHGNGWRGRWREGDRQLTTRTVRTKGEARALLNAELHRIELGDRYRPPITLAEMADRFLTQYVAQPQTIEYARRRLKRPLAALGSAQAADVSPEALQRVLAAVPGKAWRHDMLRALRMVYRFGIDNHLVDTNPTRLVKVPKPVRGERILPLTIPEVDRVAEECGRWGNLVVFMADSGARPSEARMLEHKHVDLDAGTVELASKHAKTELSWRTVHLTGRGVDAIRSMPRAITTRCVFHIDGRPISWPYFTREVWHPALELAKLEARAPYNLRHSYALHNLQAGVPIATLARQMGHSDVSRTFTVYGGWVREMGADAAAMRSAWMETEAARAQSVTKTAGKPLPEPE